VKVKTFIFSILFILPFAAIAQRTFKVSLISADTGKPMAKKWVAKNSQTVIKFTPAAYSMPYGCGTRMYPGYQPKEPYSITELPVAIQAKVKSYLSARVGKDFYKKLVLNGGQIIDIEGLYVAYPKARSWESVPPIYSLCFMVWDSLKRSTSYNFLLNLNQEGTLLGIVELPDIKHNAAKAKIITMDEAKKIALANNFYDKYTDVESSYDKKLDCIVWVFEQLEPGEGSRNLTKLFINAHTGAIVEKVTTKVNVMY